MVRWVYQRGLGRNLVRDNLAAETSDTQRLAAARRPLIATSGLFRVPREPNQTFNLYVYNPGPSALTTNIQVNRVVEGGGIDSKEPFFAEPFTLPAGEVFSFNVDAPAGDILEINQIRPADNEENSQQAAAVVSGTVTQFFPADAGITPQVTIPAGSFVMPLSPPAGMAANKIEAPGVTNGFQAAPTGRLTSGVINMPQGVAAARPQAELLLSSFVDRPMTASISVKEKAEHLAALQPKVERSVRVLAQGAAVVPLESVEGLPVEVELDLPPGLVASLDVYTLFLADNSTLPVFRLGPGDWAPLG